MFSPHLTEGGPAKGTRSSRRRQRPLSSDSLVQQPKAKRQRLPLTESTFVNPEAPPEMFEVKPDRIDLLGARSDGIENFAVPRKELSVRSKKPKAGERASKGDGSVVLTSTAAYTVSKLPALPDRIRRDPGSRQHGSFSPSTGFGVSLTHTHALVWPYTLAQTSPETFVFTLAYPSKHASDPLPLGSLVPPPASSREPGLVVVMPVSGKITYWETISSAATLDFIRQQRNGVEESIHGMFSSEHVCQIVSAESVGFILVFTSGRLAYMGVRDSHGRPAISVQFLRGTNGNNGGGFFGSIKHALTSSAFRNDLAAVKVSQSSKMGERVVVAATSKGKLQSWRVQRGGHHDMLGEHDVRDNLMWFLKDTVPSLKSFAPEALEVVDFAFIPRGLEQKYADMSGLSDAVSSESESVQHLLLLVSLTNKQQCQYALVETILLPDNVQMGLVRPISCYSTPPDATALEPPRLYLPRPALVAFVVFDRAVVMASIAPPPVSPETQLQAYSGSNFSGTFEDVIDFRDEGLHEIIGSASEEPFSPGQALEESRTLRTKSKNPAAVLLVRGVGTVRVAINDVDRFGGDGAPQVNAKTRLEQAVFFGIKDDNPLLFDGRRDVNFSPEDIGNAALDISNEILSSTTPYISSLPLGLEPNILARLNYVEKLISHLNVLKVDLNPTTRRMLLANAEKLHVALWIWKEHEVFLSERSKGRKKTIVTEITEYISENEKTEPNPSIGEVDIVRHWFIHDIWRLELFLAWSYEVIKYTYKDRILDDVDINRLLYESVTISQGALAEALEYRSNKAAAYGFSTAAAMIEANPASGPWTATKFITNNFKRLVEFCYEWLRSKSENKDLDLGLLDEIRLTLPALTDQLLFAFKEHRRWSLKSDDPAIVAFGETCWKQYLNDRYEKILKLKEFKLHEPAIQLAEKHEAFTAMAEILVDEVKDLKEQATSRAVPLSKAVEFDTIAGKKEQEIGQFMLKYQEKFAFAVYSVLLRSSGVQAVLDFPCDKNGYATKFLRTKPELAKISWINDIEREKDIDHAAETLLNLGMSREQKVWNKKIELSLGKLALMAESAERASSGSKELKSKETRAAKGKIGIGLKQVNRELAIIKIQDYLYKQITVSTSNAVDEAAELDLAMETHSRNIPKKHKALLQVFENGMSRLLKHEALDAFTLIDLLTLSSVRLDRQNVSTDPFLRALEVAEYSLKGEERINAQRLIWRRCLVQDDWKMVNDTVAKDDEDTLRMIGQTAPYRAIYAVLASNLSEQTPQLPLIKPSECLGVYTSALDRRFAELDDAFRNRLLEAMKAEDARLAMFIDKCRLEKWHRSTREEAEKAVTTALDQKTANGAGQGDGMSPAATGDGQGQNMS